MAGLTDIKNKLPKMKKPNGVTHSTNTLQVLVAVLIFVLFLVFFTSCKPRKEIHTKEVSYKETLRDTTVYLPGEVVTAPLSEEFLKALEKRFKSNSKDTVRIVSRTGLAELQLWQDEITGQLMAACEAKDREIDLLLKTIEKFETKSVEKVKTEYRMAWWGWLTVVVCLALIINLIRFKFKI